MWGQMRLLRLLSSWALKSCKCGSRSACFSAGLSSWERKFSLYPVCMSLVSIYVHHEKSGSVLLMDSCRPWQAAVSCPCHHLFHRPNKPLSSQGECSSLWPSWWPSVELAPFYRHLLFWLPNLNAVFRCV